MTKINVLDPSIYNLISAGEVAVNPAGVVKELVENSLDAKASKITVEIWSGGKDKIKITDNGCGIAKSEVKFAFLPHATSKISKKEDIYHISTLGFRGEALASICNVSKLSMITRTSEEEIGTFIEIDAGKIISVEERACNVGTEIVVSNLFYNTPARLKFLGNEKFEQREVSKVMENLMLANHSIEFEFYIDGKLKTKTKSSSLERTIIEVEGIEFLNNSFPIEAQNEKYKIQGYAILPSYETQNRFMRCFVNGRVTNNHCISSAILSIYSDYSMRNSQPSFIVFFDLPYDEVDVNITPQKTDVKFENDHEIFFWVADATRNSLLNFTTLENKMEAEEIIEKDLKRRLRTEDNDGNIIFKEDLKSKNLDVDPYKVIETLSKDNANKNLNQAEFLEKYKEIKSIEQERLKKEQDKLKIEEEKRAKQIEIFSFNNSVEEENDAFELKTDSEIMQSVKNYRNSNNVKIDEKIIDEKQMAKNVMQSVKQELTQMSFIKTKYKVLGVIFSTYVLVQMENAFVIIDQHAAHERYLFDKFMEEVNNRNIEVQELMLPYTIIADNDKANFLDANLQTLNDLGFKIETFGNNFYKLESVPMILSDIDLDYFFDTIYENKMYITNIDGQLKEKLAMKACKSAIKAGMTLSDTEIEQLIEIIKNTKSPLLCPHGRPYCLKILKSDIEKWFKRIV